MSSAVEIVVGSCPRCGQPWPECACGKPTPPKSVPDHMEPEPPAPEGEPTEPEPDEGTTPFVEWVQWRSGKRGELSRYHVRVTSGGWLLCGRHVPPGIVPAADSFAPHGERCAVCRSKLRGLAS